MSDEDALLRAIAATPEDDLPRLVYADWLDEHDQPERAEFVRLQCELAAMPAADPTRPFLTWRHKHFLRTRVPEWLRELPRWPGVGWGDFERGLVTEVHADDAAALARHGSRAFRAQPVETVRLTRLGDPAALARFPELGQIR